MAKKKILDAKNLELMKDWFSKPKNEESFEKEIPSIDPLKVDKVRPKKPRITVPIRAYIKHTNKDAFDDNGEKTDAYNKWYKSVWPKIRSQESSTKTITTITKTVTETIESPDMASLISENTKTLRTLTDYIRSMDKSLKSMAEGPISVKITK